MLAPSPPAPLSPAQHRAAEPDDRKLIDRLWRGLVDAGAFRAGRFADRETWLVKRYSQRHPEYLTDRQAALAVGELSGWLERVQSQGQAAPAAARRSFARMVR